VGDKISHSSSCGDDYSPPPTELCPPLVPFRDAAFDICSFSLTVSDCLTALEKATSLHHFSLSHFDLNAYEYYETLEHGDMNWIIPQKLLAFSGPLAK